MAADWNPNEGFETEVPAPEAASDTSAAWSPNEGFDAPAPAAPVEASTPTPQPKAFASAGTGGTVPDAAPPADSPDAVQDTTTWDPNEGFDTPVAVDASTPLGESPQAPQPQDDGGGETAPAPQTSTGNWFEDRARDVGNWVQDIGEGFAVAGEGVQRVQQGDIGGGLAQVGGGLAEGIGTAIKPVNDAIMAPFIFAGRTLPQAYNAAKDLADDNVDPNSVQGQLLEGARNSGWLGATFGDLASAGANVGQTLGTQGFDAAAQQVGQAFQQAEGKGWGDYASLEDTPVSIPQNVPIVGGISTTIPLKTAANLSGEIAPYFAPVFGQVGAAGKGLSALGGAGKVAGAPLQVYGRVGQAALEAPNRLVTAVAGGPKIGAALTAGAFTTYLGATAVPKIEKTDEQGNVSTIWDPSRVMGSDPSGIVLPMVVALGGAALWRGGGGATIAFDKALGATGNALRGRVLTQITSSEKPVYVRDGGPAVDMGQGAPVPVPLEVVGVNRNRLPNGVRVAEPGEVVAKYSNIAQDRPISAATRSLQGVEQVIADIARAADNDPQAAGPILRDFLTNPDSTVTGGLDTPDVKAARTLLNKTIDRYVDIEKNTVLGAQDARTDVINRLLLQNGGDGAQFGATIMQKAADEIVRSLGIKNADWETSNIRRFTALADQLNEDRTLAVRLGEQLKRQGGNAAVLIKDSPEYRGLLGKFVDPAEAGSTRGMVERRVGQTLQQIERAWKETQRQGQAEGVVFRTPDALNPRLRGFGQNTFVDAMATSKAIMSPYLLSGAPRYFINNLIGDSINLAMSTHGRAFGTVTEGAMRQRLSNWGLGGVLDGQWASGGSIKNAMGQDVAPYRLPNQTGRVRALDQWAKDRAPGLTGVWDTVTLNRPLRAFGERVQDMAVLGEAYRRRMAITAEVLPVVERNFARYVEQRARANGATPNQARQLARDAVQAVNEQGLSALQQPRFKVPGLDLDGIPREYQADIRRAWTESRGNPAVFQRRVNTLLDDALATIKDTIDGSAATQARNLYGVIVDGTPYQPPATTSIRNTGTPPGNRQTARTGVTNRPGDLFPDPAQSRQSDLTAARNEPLTGSTQGRPGTGTVTNAPLPANAAQIPVSGVSNRVKNLVPDDVINIARGIGDNSVPATPQARSALSALLQEVRAAEGRARGEYRSHSVNVKNAAGERLGKADQDMLSGRVFDDGLDLEPRQVYRNAIAIIQAESGLTKSGSTRKFYDLGKLEAVIRSGSSGRLTETQRFLRAYQSFLDNYDVLRLPKGKEKAVPVVTVRKGTVTTPSTAAELQAYLDAVRRAGDARQAMLANATRDVGQTRLSDILGSRNDPYAPATQARAVTGDATNQGLRVEPPPAAPTSGIREPWQMTREQWVSQPREWTVGKRDMTLNEWRAANGYGNPLDEQGAQRFPRGISKAQQRRNEADLARRRASQDAGAAEYERLRAAGQLPKVEEARSIRADGLDLEGQLAAARVYHKRQVAAAVNAGEPVPLAVLKDYPDLAAKAASIPSRPVTAPVRPEPVPLPNPDAQTPTTFRGTQPTPAQIRGADTQPRTGADALNLANQGLPEVFGQAPKTLPTDGVPARSRAAAAFRAENGIPPSGITPDFGPNAQRSAPAGGTNTPKAAPPPGDPRMGLDDVMARTMQDHLAMAAAFDDLTKKVMALPDDVRRAPDLPDRIRDAMNDPIYGGDPKIKAVADAMEALDQRRSTYQQAVDSAMRDTGVNNGKVLDPQVTRRILDDIPDPVNPGWKNPDGSDYTGPAFMQGNQWLGRDGQPLTFTRSMAWGADPVPDVVARIGDLHEAIRGKLTTATSTITPTDARFLKPGELQDALRLAQQMASREGTSKARAMLFGYDDRSQGQYLLDHWSPYSYWTVSHMLRTAQYLAPNPQVFAGMAIGIRQVAEMNKDQAPWDRFSVALFTAPDGTTVRLNPAQFFPYATQGVASMVAPDDESLAKNLLDLFGLSAHVPINLAMQWVTTMNPDNPYTTWYTGTKPGEKRARALTPQTELLRLLSGGTIDIEGGKLFGASVPSFRKAIYGGEAPASNATAATLELARRVFAGELTELDARRAILSWKDGQPNDVYRDAESQGLRDKGIGALVRFLGGPVSITSAEANRINRLYDQLGDIPKTDKKAAAALFDQNPDLSVYSSAGQNTTADGLRRSIAIDEQPIYTGGTPEQQARWAEADRVYSAASGAVYDANPTAGLTGAALNAIHAQARQAGEAALRAAGLTMTDYRVGQGYENTERKRLLAEAGGYDYTAPQARYRDNPSPEESAKRDSIRDEYFALRDQGLSGRNAQAQVSSRYGAAAFQQAMDQYIPASERGGAGGTGNAGSAGPGGSSLAGTPTGGSSSVSSGNYRPTSSSNNVRRQPTGRGTSSSYVDWDRDPVATNLDGQSITVRQFWDEQNRLRDAGQHNAASRQLATNWDALLAAGVRLTGEKPTYRSDDQEKAYQTRRDLLDQYGRLKSIDERAASQFWATNAELLDKLLIQSGGTPKPQIPRPIQSTRLGEYQPYVGRRGGSIRVPRRPFTPRPVPRPATLHTDPDASALRAFLSGKQGLPAEAYLKRLRLRYALGIPADAPMELWLEAVKTALLGAVAA